MGEEIKVYMVLVGKPEGKSPLGSPRRRWEDGIRMDLGETGLGGCGLDSTSSGQGPVASCCEYDDEPLGSCATELVITQLPFHRLHKLQIRKYIHTYLSTCICFTKYNFSVWWMQTHYS
jgi:hypothetical protein